MQDQIIGESQNTRHRERLLRKKGTALHSVPYLTQIIIKLWIISHRSALHLTASPDRVIVRALWWEWLLEVKWQALLWWNAGCRHWRFHGLNNRYWCISIPIWRYSNPPSRLFAEWSNVMKNGIDDKTFNMTNSIDPLNATMLYSIKTMYSSYLVGPFMISSTSCPCSPWIL